jgi:hypothetical protein
MEMIKTSYESFGGSVNNAALSNTKDDRTSITPLEEESTSLCKKKEQSPRHL